MLTATPTLAPYFLRDLAAGLQQQMFFWGQDVVHPEGNFLTEQGFTRSASTGLKGTSCYRRTWQDGHIELYGSCAGWYNQDGGFAFIRPQRRCVVWLSGEVTPIPGAWEKKHISSSATKEDLYLASLPFLDWLISYEQTLLAELGHDYRNANYWKYKKVPKAKAWLEPELALQWFQCFRETPDQLVRPKRFSHKKNV